MPTYTPSSKQEIPGHLSWSVVIISLILCWPIGLVLLALRLKHDKASQMGGGKAMVIVGALVAAFFGLGFIITLTDKRETAGTAFAMFMLCAGGLALVYFGQKTTKSAAAVRRYIDLIVNQKQTSVDGIASMTGRTDIPAVTAEIQDMIDKGFLHGFTLDRDTRMIYRTAGAASPVMASSSGQSRTAAFKCRTCGANNTEAVVDGVAICAYCESANNV